jgi:hypothetical protein
MRKLLSSVLSLAALGAAFASPVEARTDFDYISSYDDGTISFGKVIAREGRYVAYALRWINDPETDEFENYYQKVVDCVGEKRFTNGQFVSVDSSGSNRDEYKWACKNHSSYDAGRANKPFQYIYTADDGTVTLGKVLVKQGQISYLAYHEIKNGQTKRWATSIDCSRGYSFNSGSWSRVGNNGWDRETYNYVCKGLPLI